MGAILNGLQRLHVQSNNLFTAAIILLFIIISIPFIARISFPKSAPPFLPGSRQLDASGFSKGRTEYLETGKQRSQSGHFSFWYGPNHTVAVSGSVGRSVFFTARGLDPITGYTRILWQAYKRCSRDEHLAQNLPRVVNDVSQCVEQLNRSNIVDPMDVIGRLSYQITHRVLGSHGIADNPKLVDETRAIYKPLRESSIFDIWFPLLPTPAKVQKIWGYASLHSSLKRIITDRRKMNKVDSDAMQILMELGVADPLITLAIIGAILAGVFNMAVSVTWNLYYLSQHPEWLNKVRQEADSAIETFRVSQDETLTDIVRRLSLNEWETMFPTLELTFKESLRFVMSGAIVTKNISKNDISIGNTGYAIPRNSLVVYSAQDAHMDERIYKDPHRWDPSRFDKQRNEGADTPHSYLGWGSGIHPCPAQRSSRLNMTILTVMFITSFDFGRCDSEGNDVVGPLPKLDFDRVGAGIPTADVYMKLKQRGLV
ncbi:cytochrome P450 [Xylariales sp. PMI_506]|nr:cytochrome P450 [Xylariales sp. PMI_506]